MSDRVLGKPFTDDAMQERPLVARIINCTNWLLIIGAMRGCVPAPTHHVPLAPGSQPYPSTPPAAQIPTICSEHRAAATAAAILNMAASPPPAPALKLNSSEAAPPTTLGYTQPCIVNAFLSALPSGVIGWVLGVLPSMFRNVGFKHMNTWLEDGRASGINLFVISGTYSFSHCLLTRVRQTDDALNRGIAGCMTGLAMGWSAGPMSAAQSCAAIGLISYVVDLGGSEQPAKASTMSITSHVKKADRASAAAAARSGSESGSTSAAAYPAPGSRAARGSRAGDRVKHMLAAAAVHRLPPVMWLGAVCGSGSGSGAGYLDLPAWGPRR